MVASCSSKGSSYLRTCEYLIVSFQQQGIIVINRLNYNFNKDYAIINCTIVAVPGKASFFNANINLTADHLAKMTMNIKMMLQGDKEYRKEFFRVPIDLEKLFGGGVDSFIGKTFLSGLAEAVDFPLKFPLTKVIPKFKVLKVLKHSNNIFLRASTTSRISR